MEQAKYLADPSNFYTNIKIYNLDNGILLNTIILSNNDFEITAGSINRNNAIFKIVIDNNIIGEQL